MATKKLGKIGPLMQKASSLGVNPQVNSSKKKKNKNKNNQTTGAGGDNDVNCYKLALANPFHDDAVGARVPDMYSYPTATYHAEGTFMVKTNASGVGSVTILPHPFLSLIDMTGSTVNTPNGMFTYGAGDYYAAAKQSNLAGQLTNFRTVGMGIEIRNVSPPTSATGDVIIAKVPISGQLAGPTALGSLTDVQSMCKVVLGLDPGSTTVGWTSDILELPDSDETSIQNLIGNALQVNCKPINSDAFIMRATNNDAVVAAANNLASGVVVNNSGVPNYIDALVSELFNGWDAILITTQGAPVSQNVLEVKYIYHFEGTPALPSGAGTVVPSMEVARFVRPLALWSSLEEALNRPSIQLISKVIGEAARSFYSNNKDAVNKLVRSKLGLDI